MMYRDEPMPINVSLFVSKTTHLTTEQLGAYTLLIAKAWRMGDEGVLDDDAQLARICRVSTVRWRRHLRPALAEFFDTSAGSWHPKLLERSPPMPLFNILYGREDLT